MKNLLATTLKTFRNNYENIQTNQKLVLTVILLLMIRQITRRNSQKFAENPFYWQHDSFIFEIVDIMMHSLSFIFNAH